MSLKPVTLLTIGVAAQLAAWLLVVRCFGGAASTVKSNNKPMVKASDFPLMPKAAADSVEETNPATISVTFTWDDTNSVPSAAYWLAWGTNTFKTYTVSNLFTTNAATLELPFGENPPRIFIAVAAAGSNGLVSVPSRELRLPEFPPNRVVLSWPTNSASIQHATKVLGPWSNSTNYSGTNVDWPIVSGAHFFRATQSLKINSYFKEP